MSFILFVWAAVTSGNSHVDTKYDWVSRAEFSSQQPCEDAAKALSLKHYRCLRK